MSIVGVFCLFGDVKMERCYSGGKKKQGINCEFATA